MTNDFGLKCNFSLVQNADGKISAGLHYTDTKGNEVDTVKEGNDYFSVLLDLEDEVIKEFTTPKEKVEEWIEPTEVELLSLENEMLREEIDFLRTKLDDALTDNEALEDLLFEEPEKKEEEKKECECGKAFKVRYISPFDFLTYIKG